MTQSGAEYLQRAIGILSQSDPIVKLLKEVKLGRMKPTDPGLRAVTESWLGTYQRVLDDASSLDLTGVLRLDPAPRLQVLIDAGVLAAEQPAVVSLRRAFQAALDRVQAGSGVPGAI